MRYISRAIALSCLVSSSALAAGGDLDESFGVRGRAVADVGLPFATGVDLAIHTDGKIVVAAEAGGQYGAPDAFAAARFDSAGVPDATFAGDGSVTTDIGPFFDLPVKVLVQSDGKIIVAGMTVVLDGFADIDPALVRYNTDGSLDATFGTGGVVVHAFSSGQDSLNSAALQADGKIVFVGSHGASDDAYVARLDSTGALDATFGTGGIVSLDFEGRSDGARAIAVQTDGAIVFAGTSFDGEFFGDGTVGTLARLDAGGTLDPGFGVGGKIIEGPASNDLFDAVVIQADGRIVALGASGLNQNLVPRLHRYDSSGIEDGSFAGGPVYLGPGTSGSLAIGATGEFAVLDFNFAVSRVTTSGDLDTSFGNAGRAALGMVSLGYAGATAIDAARGVLLAGESVPDYFADDFETRLTVVRLTGASSSCTVDADCGACEHCETGQCRTGSRSGCIDADAGAAKLKLVSVPYIGRAKTSFLWKGAVPAFNPSISDEVTMCLFHGQDRVMKVRMPAAGTCDDKPCWSSSGDGKYKYADKDLTPDGVRKAVVIPGTLAVNARGFELQDTADGVPDAYLLGVTTPPLLLQVHGGANACIEATFDTQRVLGNRRVSAVND
jgi:uncharacterized delta-60 repeat protein